MLSCYQINLISFRDSGIGDHGPDGIKSFVSQHHCNNVCHGLKLEPLFEEEKDISNAEDDED